MENVNKILFVASEALPFVSSGGLGDVIGSLPKELKKLSGDSLDIRVVIPMYTLIPESIKAEFKKECEFYVPLAWRKQYCGVYSYETDGVIFYFIDNEYYFKRNMLYGSFDDAERYAYFCRAALEMLRYVGFYPDILHAHDWQSALSVIYLNSKYRGIQGYENIRTVFTIHNIEYQGIYGFDIFGDIFDLEPKDMDTVDYDGAINLMKGAILKADRVTTVSPTYAKEILEPEHSHGLHYILNENKSKLIGIVNGIDENYYNPSKDAELFVNYTYRSLKRKKQNKVELQKMLSLPQNEDIPVVAMITRLATHKGIDLVSYAADRLLEKDIQFVLLGTGDFHYETFFTKLHERYPSKCASLLTFNKDLSKKIYASADIFLMPSRSEPCGLSQMIASRYGTIPVVRSVGGLYDTIKDGVNGFSFGDYNGEAMLDAVNRALSLYYDSEKWNELMKTVIKTDFSWKKSAVSYFEMYKSIG